MRISSAHIKGFGPFRDVTIDFDALPQQNKLIALCGDNGEGKSTLVDLLVDGAAWRDWPRRGGSKIDHVATARDSLLEVIHEYGGKRYDIKHLVDNVNGKGESAVYLNGDALTKSGKLTEFYSFAKENFAAKSVVHSSIVSHPAYGSFVTMKPTERKDVILLALGVEGIEKLAKSARDEVEASRLRTERIRADIAKEVENSYVATAEVELCHKQEELYEAERVLAEAVSSLDVARQLAGDSALARQRYDEQLATYEALKQRSESASRALSDADAALAVDNVGACEAKLAEVKTEREAAKVALDKAEAEARRLQTLRDAAQRQSEDRYRVQLELERATAAKADVEKRLTNIRDTLAKADEIRDASKKLEKLTKDARKAEFDAASAEAEVRRLSAEIAVCDAEVKRNRETASEASKRIEQANRVLLDATACRSAAIAVDKEREAVSDCRKKLAEAEAHLEELRSRRVSGADDRIVALRGGLTRIRDSANHLVSADYAEETLNGDDDAVLEAEALPGLLESAASKVEAYRSRVCLSEERLRECEALAAKLPMIEVATLELASATAARDSALTAATTAETNAADVATRRAATSRIGLASAEVARSLEEEIAKLSKLAAQSERLAAAEALLEERTRQLATLAVDIERLTEELAALPEPEPVPNDPYILGIRKEAELASEWVVEAEKRLASAIATRTQLESQLERLRGEAQAANAQLEAVTAPVPPEAAPDVTEREEAATVARTNQTSAAQAVGAATARLEAAQKAATRLFELRADLAAESIELADWTRLAADLGRKGLQAALVDSAAPELTRATNDLLHSCFGPRWTVSYETQRVNGNGSVSEGYDIRIIDTERGRDGVVEDLSDGERTIVGEAASLALTELACKRAGFESPTLIRDESGAALSPEKRPMWVAMLRRAAEHVNADRVIVISHSEDVQEMCDVRMRVAGGEVTVEL